MNSKTFNKRYNNLLREICIHPHKEEVLNIMYQQIRDEVDTPTTLSKSTYI